MKLGLPFRSGRAPLAATPESSATSGRYATPIALFVVLLLFGGTAIMQDQGQLPEGDQCITCHMDVEMMPEDFARHDVHLRQELSCAGCHGGDPTVDDDELAKAPGTGFVGVPTKDEIPAFCGKCHADPSFMRTFQPRMHTDQLEQYYISKHGTKLKEGDQNVADCASCHTAHAILPANDARSSVHPLNVPKTCDGCHGDADYMGDYGIRTNQYEGFAASVHGKALLENEDIGAPACNDCHGNHGALPPEVANLGEVCGTCHANNALYFSQSAMAEPFQEDELHACIECHGYHTVAKTFDEMVGVGENSVCMDCHSEGEDAYEAAELMYARLSTLVAAHDSATVERTRVARLGMDDVDMEYMIAAAHQSLIQARTLVHTFDPDRVGEKTDEGIAEARAALAEAGVQVREHRMRRVGLGLATLFITMLAVGLFLKIREDEQRPLVS